MTIQINGTSGISGVDGSAGTPALQGSDTNTGISFGTDTVNINTGGTTRATVDSSGRLLVGTSSALGSVAKLAEVNGNANISRFANDAFAHQLGFVKSRGASPGTIVQNGDELGIVNWYADDGTDTATAAAQIAAYVDGTPGSNDMPGRLVFSTTADGASSPTERMRIINSGAVLVNDTALRDFTGQSFQVSGYSMFYQTSSTTSASVFTHTGSSTQTVCSFRQGNPAATVGSITVSGGTSTAYNTSSDYRLKENITAVTDSIARLLQLKPSRFNFIADPDRTVDGFIAHEVQSVVPEAITGEKDAVDDEGNPIYQGIDQSKLVPLLTAALQEAIAKIESLETRLTALEGGAAS